MAEAEVFEMHEAAITWDLSLQDPPRLSQAERIERLKDRLGERGLALADLPDPEELAEFNTLLAELGFVSAVERVALRKAVREHMARQTAQGQEQHRDSNAYSWLGPPAGGWKVGSDLATTSLDDGGECAAGGDPLLGASTSAASCGADNGEDDATSSCMTLPPPPTADAAAGPAPPCRERSDGARLALDELRRAVAVGDAGVRRTIGVPPAHCKDADLWGPLDARGRKSLGGAGRLPPQQRVHACRSSSPPLPCGAGHRAVAAPPRAVHVVRAAPLVVTAVAAAPAGGYPMVSVPAGRPPAAVAPPPCVAAPARALPGPGASVAIRGGVPPLAVAASAVPVVASPAPLVVGRRAAGPGSPSPSRLAQQGSASSVSVLPWEHRAAPLLSATRDATASRGMASSTAPSAATRASPLLPVARDSVPSARVRPLLSATRDVAATAACRQRSPVVYAVAATAGVDRLAGPLRATHRPPSALPIVGRDHAPVGMRQAVPLAAPRAASPAVLATPVAAAERQAE